MNLIKKYWMAISLAVVAMCSFSSCNKDDEEKEKKEEVNYVEQGTKTGTDALDILGDIKPAEDDVIALAQLGSLSNDQLTTLSEVLIDYAANKDVEEWMTAFKDATNDNENVVANLDKVISLAEENGIFIEEFDSETLKNAILSLFGEGDYGEGYNGGMAYSTKFLPLYEEIYDSKLKDVDATDVTALLPIFQSLTNEQQASLIDACKAWNSKTNDEEWKNGFLAGVKAKGGEEAATQLRALFDNCAPYVAYL